MDIFDRIARDSGGPLGQYRQKAFGYYMYPKLEGGDRPTHEIQGQGSPLLESQQLSRPCQSSGSEEGGTPRLRRNGGLHTLWAAV